MNILVINLTRFGDLLQTQPLILGLKEQGHNVGLLCLENFAAATALLQGIDYVLPISGSTFLHALHGPPSQDRTAPSISTWPLAIQHVENLALHVYENFPIQMIINTTATLASRLLARRVVLAHTKNVEHSAEIPILGFGLDEHGFGQSGDMWATFLQGASAERLNCPFNIVDMFRSVAKVAHLPPSYGLQATQAPLRQAARDFLQEQELDVTIKGYVAFQLGASEKRRQWPVQSFAAVGQTLWQQEGLCPILLGSPAEKELAQKYATLATDHPFVDAIGKTNIPQLAALLEECTLIVSNDTGTMHLAAGLKIPVLALFLATAQAFDTGPYMSNACCLEPALPCHPCPFHQPCSQTTTLDHIEEHSQPCLYSITPATVTQLVQHFIHHGSWDAPIARQQQSARIWKSTQDNTGFMQLEGLSGHENEERTHWLHIQRQFYRHILDEGQQQGRSLILEKKHIQGLSEALKQEVARTLGQCTQLLLLVQEHMQLLQRMPSKQGGKRILSTCTTIYGVLEKCPYLKALGHLWLVLFQEKGAQWDNFAQLVKSLRETFLTLSNALEYQENT